MPKEEKLKQADVYMEIFDQEDYFSNDRPNTWRKRHEVWVVIYCTEI